MRARVTTLVTLKRARDLLQASLASQVKDVEDLARELTVRKQDLENALAALRVARDAAERASQLKSDFLGMVSHELRTPVTALLLQLERLQRDSGAAALTEPQREIVRRMGASAARLQDMIEALLQHARLESGRLKTEVTTFDLGRLVSEVVGAARPQADQKGLELRVAADPALPPLRSDPQLVRLVLMHLLTNAIKFTERGTVEVSLRQEGEDRLLEVRDTGQGIPPEARGRIFEPFVQLEDVRKKHIPGVGLGLALVKTTVAALGGRIELTSEVGQGSTFTVVLPPAP